MYKASATLLLSNFKLIQFKERHNIYYREDMFHIIERDMFQRLIYSQYFIGCRWLSFYADRSVALSICAMIYITDLGPNPCQIKIILFSSNA